jgi:O-Antigen ligase
MRPSHQFRWLLASGHIFVWAFFILIFDGATVIAASKYGLPVKPTYVYAITSLGLLTTAVLTSGWSKLLNDKAFFVPFLAIAALGVAMYRGENSGPDFGGIVSRLSPSSISYVVWPILNLAASAGLYLLARHDDMRRSIVAAAFATLVLQFATMEADMWWFALFGDPNGRAGGLAQNANIAALLVATLASLTLPNRSLSPFAVMLAITGTILTQSKSGLLSAAILVICFAFTVPRRELLRWPIPTFAALLVAMLAATAIFSPVLNPTPETLAKRQQIIAEYQSQQQLPVNPLDVPISLEERLKARTSVDVAAELRREALKFYAGILMERPAALLIGMGPGFTNKFATGPHNGFLKLAVDNGIIASLLLLFLLVSTSRKAFVARSPELASLTLISWLAVIFTHTSMVDPFTLPALAIGLASLRKARNRETPP